MNNIDPTHWGPHVWAASFFIALGYPDNPTETDKQNALSYYQSMGKLLPCSTCRVNFQHHLLKYPLDYSVVSNRYTLIMWLINIKNEVNTMLNKPLDTFNDIINKYTNKPSIYSYKNIFIVSVIIIVIFGLIYYVKTKQVT